MLVNIPLIHSPYFWSSIWTLSGLLILMIVRMTVGAYIGHRGQHGDFNAYRIAYVKKVIYFLIGLGYAIYLGWVWKVDFAGLALYLASLLTIVGVALFATWSILSNITASMVLFFFFPFRVGSKVKILDGESSISGTVLALSMFSVRIQTDQGEVYCPNSVVIQKSVLLIHSQEEKV